MNNTGKQQQLPVAEVKPGFGVGVGDFPIGSIESRAAARMLASRKSAEKQVIQIRFVSPDGRVEDGPRIVIDE